MTEGELARYQEEAGWEPKGLIGTEFDFANREEELEWFRHALEVEQTISTGQTQKHKTAHQVTVGQQRNG